MMIDTPEERESAVFSAIAQRNRAEKAERERDEARGQVRYRDVLLVRWCHSEGGTNGERLYEDTMTVLDPEDKGHGLHDPLAAAEATIKAIEALVRRMRSRYGTSRDAMADELEVVLKEVKR